MVHWLYGSTLGDDMPATGVIVLVADADTRTELAQVGRVLHTLLRRVACCEL